MYVQYIYYAYRIIRCMDLYDKRKKLPKKLLYTIVDYSRLAYCIVFSQRAIIDFECFNRLAYHYVNESGIRHGTGQLVESCVLSK